MDTCLVLFIVYFPQILEDLKYIVDCLKDSVFRECAVCLYCACNKQIVRHRYYFTGGLRSN